MSRGWLYLSMARGLGWVPVWDRIGSPSRCAFSNIGKFVGSEGIVPAQHGIDLDAAQPELETAFDLFHVVIFHRIDGHEPDQLVGIALDPLRRKVVGAADAGGDASDAEHDRPVHYFHGPVVFPG